MLVKASRIIELYRRLILLTVGAAPHPPFGHLLPVKDGEKVAGRNVAACPFSPFFTGRRCPKGG